MIRYAIVAGGPESLLPDLRDPYFNDVHWIGADHGTVVLMQHGIVPECAFGDFDSLTDEEWKRVCHATFDRSVFPPEKDRTDLEIAVDWVLERQPDECLILGGSGGRLDHTLVNVRLLLKGVHTGTNMSLLDCTNRITILQPGTYTVKRDPSYVYLSFLALTGAVSGLTLKGVKYPLDDADLSIESGLCISNEVAENAATVSFSKGVLMMIRCSDRSGGEDQE